MDTLELHPQFYNAVECSVKHFVVFVPVSSLQRNVWILLVLCHR